MEINKKHRKGGRSEKIFACRTEEQRKDFLRKVSNKIEEEFKNYKLDYVIFSRGRLPRAPLLREYKYLQREAQKISQRVLNLKDTDNKAFNHALREITNSVVPTF